MLIPISFGIGAALTALVGTNIGARQFRRAQRLAWAGALMAGAIAAAIGIVVAIWPDLWLGLFVSDARVLASGRHYLSIVGPVYGLFGLAMALYFASQGTGEMVWPVAANLARIAIASTNSAGASRAFMPVSPPASRPSRCCSPSRRHAGRGLARDRWRLKQIFRIATRWAASSMPAITPRPSASCAPRKSSGSTAPISAIAATPPWMWSGPQK
jgi:hypothetical protein